MAINFPSNPSNNDIFTDPNGQQWKYNSSEKSWTALGISVDPGGLDYKGGLNITSAPPTAASGEFWSVETGGTANAGFAPGVTGTINAGSFVLYDGVNWELLEVSSLWNRTGGLIQPVNQSDTIQTDSGLKVGPSGTPTITLNSTGSIEAAGEVKVGGGGSASNAGITLNDNGYAYFSRSNSATPLMRGYRTDTGANTFTVLADGSIAAAGTASIDGNVYAGYQTYPTTGVKLGLNGSIIATGDVKVGGTSAAPNIELVSSGGYINVQGGLFSNSVIQARRTNDSDEVFKGLDSTNATTFQVLGNGSVTAAGFIARGDVLTSTQVYSGYGTGTGLVRVFRGDNTNALIVENPAGVFNFTVKGDGSVMAAGDISTETQFNADRTSAGSTIFSGALNGIQQIKITADGTTRIGGTSSAPNIELKNDGSASFANNDLIIANDGTLSLTTSFGGSGLMMLSNKISLNGADGSISAAGPTFLAGDSAYLSIARTPPALNYAYKLIKAQADGADKFTVDVTGAVTAAGNFTFNNATSTNANFIWNGASTTGLSFYDSAASTTRARLDSDGFYIGTGADNPSGRTVELKTDGSISAAGDITCTDNSKGLILKSPDGSSWRLSVDNSGTLSASAA